METPNEIVYSNAFDLSSDIVSGADAANESPDLVFKTAAERRRNELSTRSKHYRVRTDYNRQKALASEKRRGGRLHGKPEIFSIDEELSGFEVVEVVNKTHKHDDFIRVSREYGVNVMQVLEVTQKLGTVDDAECAYFLAKEYQTPLEEVIKLYMKGGYDGTVEVLEETTFQNNKEKAIPFSSLCSDERRIARRVLNPCITIIEVTGLGLDDLLDQPEETGIHLADSVQPDRIEVDPQIAAERLKYLE